jgi:cardiolipin synthase
MLNLPNVLTVARLALIPVVAYFLARDDYAIALPIFLVAALTDLADGYLARRLGLVSRLGALLDPIADKLNMLVATVLVAWQSLLPVWLAIAIVARDALIVAGAIAWHAALGRLKIAPTMLSKVNTALEFAVLLLAMAVGARWIEAGAWLEALFIGVLATVVASGTQYAWIWARKARDAYGRVSR